MDTPAGGESGQKNPPRDNILPVPPSPPSWRFPLRVTPASPHATPGTAVHPRPARRKPLGAHARGGPVLAQPVVRPGRRSDPRGHRGLRDRVPPRPRPLAAGPRAPVHPLLARPDL